MSKTSKVPRADMNPFRIGSYSVIYDCLYHHKSGISKIDLLKLVRRQLKAIKISKPDRNLNWDIGVVCSARKDQLSHPCIRKASDTYFVEGNGVLKLHLR